MKRTLFFSCVALVVCLATLTPAAYGQAVMAGDELFLEMLKHDIREAKTEVMTNVMKLSADDAAVFWPVYKTYQDEARKLADSRVELIKEYGAAYWSITNTQAADLASRWLEYQKKRGEMTAKLYHDLAEDLSPAQALKAVQLEHRLNLILDSQIANELPMLE